MITKNNPTARIKIYFFAIAFTIGLIHAWAVRNVLDSDGLPNLDMGDAFFHGDWKAIINGMWSPLYPMVLGFVLYLFKPSSYWESTVVHFVNFSIYLVSFFCFTFFINHFIQHQKDSHKDKLSVLSEQAWVILGYILFIWTSLNLVTISRNMPDMLVTAFIYLITGILLKIKSGSMKWNTFVLLGMTLAFGYLAKAVMFVLAFVFLGVCFFAIGNQKNRIKYTLISFITFVLVSSPYILLLSKSKGHFTFGEAGKVNYLWEVNGISEMNEIKDCNMVGFSQCEKLIHPVKELYHKPRVIQYSNPFAIAPVTYPPWHDPSYWIEGLTPQIDINGLVRVLRKSSKCWADLFFQMQWILFTYLLFFFMSSSKLQNLKAIKDEWLLLTPGFTAMIMYSFVHIEVRYIGAFIVICWLGLFSALRLLDSNEVKKLTSSLIRILGVLMLCISLFSSEIFDNINDDSAYVEWKVSEFVKKAGLKPGDKVAVFPGQAYIHCARYAKVNIAAEIHLEDLDEFWSADNFVKSQIFKALKKIDIKMILTFIPPVNISETQPGWKNIKDTPYYYYVL